MLILDEATSSVDTRTELHIEHGMDRLMIGRTVFVIAHRLSTIKNVDKIAFIQEGSLAEFGTHNELMNIKNGHYKTLYNLQFKSNTASTYDEE